MKKIRNLSIIAIIILLFICSCSTKEKKKIHAGYTIQGVVSSHKESTIYLLNENNTKIDSSKITGNSFILKGNIKYSSEYYLKFKKSLKSYPILLENEKYNVLIQGDNITIIGGQLNSRLSDFSSKLENIEKEKLYFLNEYSLDKIKRELLDEHIDSLRLLEKRQTITYIKENSENLLSIRALKRIDLSIHELSTLQESLNKSSHKDLSIHIDSLLANLKISQQNEIDKKKKEVTKTKKIKRKAAILFTGDGLDGNLISLKNVMKGKKAVLIDFWASWCRPCRLLTPTLKKIYNSYKNKGFTILTVSEDRNIKDWKTGVTEDAMLDWYHMYDDFGRISTMHEIKTIPHMILIDGNGGIIKNKISISELEFQLQKICK